MTDNDGFDFAVFAKKNKCESRRLKNSLIQQSERKENEYDGEARLETRLPTPAVLQEVLSAENVLFVLRCGCLTCKLTTRTPKEQDKQLAKEIAQSTTYQILFASLSLMGGTFAVRQLDIKATNYTIEETVDRIQSSPALRASLFGHILPYWRAAKCPHPIKGTMARPEEFSCVSEQTPRREYKCFGEQFAAQLRSAAWFVRVPSFRIDNMLRIFDECQNMPFIKQKTLNREKSGGGRRYFRFELHPSYCDEMLNVSLTGLGTWQQEV